MTVINRLARVAVLALCVLAVAPAARAGGVPWRHDYRKAVREARRTGRPLLVDVGTRDCVWCRRLEASTLQDPEVARLLTDRFIPVKVDAEDERQLARDLGVSVFPTVFVAAPDLTVLHSHEGFVTASHLLDRLYQALDDLDEDRNG